MVIAGTVLIPVKGKRSHPVHLKLPIPIGTMPYQYRRHRLPVLVLQDNNADHVSTGNGQLCLGYRHGIVLISLGNLR